MASMTEQIDPNLLSFQLVGPGGPGAPGTVYDETDPEKEPAISQPPEEGEPAE